MTIVVRELLLLLIHPLACVHKITFVLVGQLQKQVHAIIRQSVQAATNVPEIMTVYRLMLFVYELAL